MSYNISMQQCRRRVKCALSQERQIWHVETSPQEYVSLETLATLHSSALLRCPAPSRLLPRSVHIHRAKMISSLLNVCAEASGPAVRSMVELNCSPLRHGAFSVVYVPQCAPGQLACFTCFRVDVRSRALSLRPIVPPTRQAFPPPHRLYHRVRRV